MRDEYDFSPEDLRKGIHGQFAGRSKEGVTLITVDRDLTHGLLDEETLTKPDTPCDEKRHPR